MKHIYKKICHNLNSRRVQLFIIFVCTTTFLLGGFMLTRGSNPSVSELAFTERSVASVGSVIPASCESSPHYAGECAVNGICDMSSPNSCSSGTLGSNAIQPDGNYHWYCDGRNGGSNSDLCWWAPPPVVNGSCDMSSPNSCSSGTLGSNAVQPNGNYHWYCDGSNGGSTSELCWWAPPPPPTPVNGSCDMSSPNSCSSGTLGSNAIQPNGNYHWYCDGSNGGSNSDLCWWAPPPAPVDGACDMSSPNSCSSGVLGVNNIQGNGDYHWYCDGQNGGSTSGLCWYVPPPSSCSNGATNPPACDNICTNGYTNYPTCGPTSCSNGATNYPACDNICTNGYTNYPTCGPTGGPTPTILQFKVCTNSTGACTAAPGTHTVPVGTPLTLYWNANADSCSAVAGPGFSTGGARTGSDPITAVAVPGTSDPYRIACRYGSGTPVQSLLYVATQISPVITVSRPTVHRGDTITVSWDTNNGDETLCTLSGGGLTDATLDAGGGGTAETGSTSVVISARTTFVLTCSGLSAAQTVEIIPDTWED